MRIAFPKDANPLVDTKLRETYGLAEGIGDRRWYYGPFGLPFVIIDPSDVSIKGQDDRLPGSLANEGKISSLTHRFAVCAIETPHWLMQKHLSEMQQLGTDPTLRSREHVQGGPARGHRIDSMLRFCRWLNEIEGLDRSMPLFPSYPHLVPEPELPTDYLVRDGYRLPRYDEWEVVCRAGSWTRHFLGDSLDFLSEYAWTNENTFATTGEGGTKKPSPNGMFDILGNVYETVLGSPTEKEHGHLDGTGVWRFKDTQVVLLRGGSFLSHRIYCSSGAEHRIQPVPDSNAGFRIVRTLSKEAIGGEQGEDLEAYGNRKISQ